MGPEDFLKADYISSPKYKKDPTLEAQRNKVRFADTREKTTVKRSHVGSQKDYASYVAQLNKDEKALKKMEKKKFKGRFGHANQKLN